MKKILILFLVFFTGNVFSENTVIAVVNSSPISLNSIQSEIFPNKSKEEIIEEVNAQIYMTLQLQKVSEFNLWSTEDDINQVLNDIAKNNDLSIEELLNFDEIDLIKNEISEKLSILNLQRFITRGLEKPTQEILNQCSDVKLEDDLKQIKIAQIIISEIDSDTQNPEQKNASIKSFLNKLSNHISKGASFETFAKLHSQHPSYKDGGVTDWLTVNNPTLEMLDSLEISKVSEIYSTIFGLAIAIKIDERFISSKLKECEEQVIYQNAEKNYAQWLEDLREQSFIEIYYDKL
ncbi:peptidylprolyl isomerase [Candidatus Thioglobus sp.]|nr:peptidylprolyl isomerase [Candidatus Thioglobus sp.]